MTKTMPAVIAVLFGLLCFWFLAVAPMNIRVALDQADRAGAEVMPATAVARRDTSVWRLMSDNRAYVRDGYYLDRPRLPTPLQVGREFWKTTGAMVLKGRTWSKRSLIFHGWVTLQSTLWGFLLGTAIGITAAVAIVYARVAEMAIMPWAVISQAVPIVALAPMIIVLTSQVGIDGRGFPKAVISAYLSFFPVLVGMVKGLRSPAVEQLDLLKTYNAQGFQSFMKLRLPASIPYLFTSLKVAIAAALVGAIVGELPTGAIRGLGARILIGDQFGTPLAIWSALFAAAILAGVLVTLLDGIQRLVLRRMGMQA